MQAPAASASIIEYLKEQTGRSVSALQRGLASEPDTAWQAKLLAACSGDEGLYQRILPFAGLIRADDLDQPVVILQGSVYVTAGADRRSTGAHYTPRILTEPIVQHTLEPLVYTGPAEGLPREQWKLRPAAELIRLKICDMAMGSGAFLVQVCRYLGERLLEALEQEEKTHRKRAHKEQPTQFLRRCGKRQKTKSAPFWRAGWWRSAVSTAWTRIRWPWRWQSCRSG